MAAAKKVAVVFGSDSDWPTMEKCVKQLAHFGVQAHVEVMSAHRTPGRVHKFAHSAEIDGFEVIIAGAGMSAALAGTIAAHTVLPVIGVPLESGSLGGVDALLSTAQMPPGVPVASMGIGSAGAKNAALVAVQILSRSDSELLGAYKRFKADQASAVEAKNSALQAKL